MQRLVSRGHVAVHVAVVVDALGPLHQERRVVLVLLHDEGVTRPVRPGRRPASCWGRAGRPAGRSPSPPCSCSRPAGRPRLAVLELLHRVGAADPDGRRAGLREGRAQRGDLPGHHRDELVGVTQLDRHAADLEQLVLRSDSEYLNRRRLSSQLLKVISKLAIWSRSSDHVNLEHVVLGTAGPARLAFDRDRELGRVALIRRQSRRPARTGWSLGRASARRAPARAAGCGGSVMRWRWPARATGWTRGTAPARCWPACPRGAPRRSSRRSATGAASGRSGRPPTGIPQRHRQLGAQRDPVGREQHVGDGQALQHADEHWPVPHERDRSAARASCGLIDISPRSLLHVADAHVIQRVGGVDDQRSTDSFSLSPRTYWISGDSSPGIGISAKVLALLTWYSVGLKHSGIGVGITRPARSAAGRASSLGGRADRGDAHQSTSPRRRVAVAERALAFHLATPARVSVSWAWLQRPMWSANIRPNTCGIVLTVHVEMDLQVMDGQHACLTHLPERTPAPGSGPRARPRAIPPRPRPGRACSSGPVHFAASPARKFHATARVPCRVISTIAPFRLAPSDWVSPASYQVHRPGSRTTPRRSVIRPQRMPHRQLVDVVVDAAFGVRRDLQLAAEAGHLAERAGGDERHQVRLRSAAGRRHPGRA